jgi:hypothetical protein
MKPAHRNRRSFATAIFIAGVISSVLALSAATKGFKESSPWLIFLFIMVSLCLFIALFAVYSYQTYASSKQAETLANLQKRMDQYLAQVGQKKKQVAETNEVLSSKEFMHKVIPDQNHNFDSIEKFTEEILKGIALELNLVQGLFFINNSKTELYELQGRYAYFSEENPHNFKEGEGLSGQVAKSQTVLNVTNIPDGYITVLSGLGKSYPKYLMIIPTIWDGHCNGIIELASFNEFSQEIVKLFTDMSTELGDSIHQFMNKEVN